ncbi:MAG: leucine-rich repeat domain-containing protein, partial [Bacteroidales bacterium]|nr:leucine-rich repeat domain-containing protein [Bacteroidales bacterium]
GYWCENSEFETVGYVTAGEQFSAEFIFTIETLASEGFIKTDEGLFYQTDSDKPGLLFSFEMEDYDAAVDFNYGMYPSDSYEVRDVLLDFSNFEFSYLGESSVEDLYTVSVSSVSSLGTVSGGGKYEKGEIAVLTATPKPGYVFAGWSGGKMSNPLRITVTSDIDIMAYFTEAQTIEIGYNEYGAKDIYDESIQWQEGSIDRILDAVDFYTYYPRIGDMFAVSLSGVSSNTGRLQVMIVDQRETANWWAELSQTVLSVDVVKGERFSLYGVIPIDNTTTWSEYYEQDIDLTEAALVLSFEYAGTSMDYGFDPTEPYVISDANLSVIYEDATSYEDAITLVYQEEAEEEGHYVYHYQGSSTNSNDAAEGYYANVEFSGIARADIVELSYMLADKSQQYDGHYFEPTTEEAVIFAQNIKSDDRVNYKFSYPLENGTNPIGSATWVDCLFAESEIDDWALYFENGKINVSVTSSPKYAEPNVSTLYTVTVSANKSSYGSVSGGGKYEQGEIITIKATPNSGYVFSGWDDGNTDNPRRVTVSANQSYVATFVAGSVTTFQKDGLFYEIKSNGTVWVTHGTEDTECYYNSIDYCITSFYTSREEQTIPEDVVIPSQVTYNGTTYTVTGISDYAFVSGRATYDYSYSEYSYLDVNSIKIPSTITYIGENAFDIDRFEIASAESFCNVSLNGGSWSRLYLNGSPLTDLVIPNSVKGAIDWRFNTSSLETVTIGDGVTSIAPYAFYDCGNLESVTIGSGVKSIGNGAFDGCDRLTSVTCKATNPPSAYSDSFSNYNGTLYVPADSKNYYDTHSVWGKFKHIESIGGGSELSDYEFHFNADGKTVTIIGSRLDLTVANIPSTVEIDGKTYTVTGLGDGALAFCDGLTVLTIPSTVTFVDDYAFTMYDNLTSLTIPDGLDLSSSDFYFISDNFYYKILNSKEVAIGQNMFEYTSSSIDIPPTVKEYGNTYTVTTIEAGSIGNVNYDSEVPISSVTIPNTVVTIEKGAFWGCTGLTSITIPSSVTTIEGGAFYECRNLTSITCLAKTPPALSWSAEVDGDILPTFENDGANITVYVPCDAVSAYKSAPVWKNLNIQCDSDIQLFTITTRANNSLYGAVSGAGEYEKGDLALLVAIPNAGYEFKQWSDGSTDNPRLEFVLSDMLFEAEFAVAQAPATYVVTLSSNNDLYGSVMGDGEYEFGETATLVAIPNTGYLFKQWDDGVTTNPRSVMVVSDMSFAATFVATYVVTLAANNNNYGSVMGDGTYEAGEVATLIAIPNAGYEFKQWNDGNTSNPRKVTVNSIMGYVATFAASQNQGSSYSVTLVSNNDNYGKVYGGGEYEKGATADLIAFANPGYEFESWNDGNTENPRTVTVSSNMVFVATFVEAQGQITPVASYVVSLSVNDDQYGTVMGDGTFVSGETISIVAVPNSGYEFKQWDDGSTANPRRVTVSSNQSFVAEFVETQGQSTTTTYTITIASNNDAYGMVVGSGEYAYGKSVSLMAIANAGYEFESWSDGSTENPRMVTVTGNAGYIATFTKTAVVSGGSNRLTAISANTDMGYVTGAGLYALNEQVILMAYPEPGYRFVKWSDGNTDNPRVVTVVTDGSLYIASFKSIATAVSEIEDEMTVSIVNRQIVVNDEAPSFVSTVTGQKIKNENLKSGIYFVVVEGKTIKVSVK